MRNKIVYVPCISDPVKRSPGFEKKALSEQKLDIMALCGYGCRYCSSNSGNYLRINQKRFADMTEAQLGERLLPNDDPSLTLLWPDVVERLETQLGRHEANWGQDQTLVFSMLTDGFSPVLVDNGTTEKVLRMLIERTRFRIRILTKNAVVGASSWIAFFAAHPNRFVVGLSTGTLDDGWARSIEIGTSPPSGRLEALARLQHSGVPTYAMLCPVFPDVLEGDRVEELIDRCDPATVEHVWAEPFNDRINWRVVRSGYPTGSFGYRWFTQAFEEGDTALWSDYATTLYARLHKKAIAEGWIAKLRYLLYENGVQPQHVRRLGSLDGILLQSKPGADGCSRNPGVAMLQT